jgi:WD40 repeat protein
MLEGHIGQVLSLAYSPDGLTLASGDEYQQVRLWDVESGTARAVLRPRRPRSWDAGVRSLAFHPDGRTLASAGGTKEVSLWDAATGARLHELDKHSTPARSVAFAGDGTLFSGSRGQGLTSGQAIAWDGSDPPGRAYQLNYIQVWSLAVAPDGQTVALGTIQGLYLWTPRETPHDACAFLPPRLRSRRPVDRFLFLRTLKSDGSVASVAFSPDRRLLAAAEEWVVGLWDVAEGRRLARLEGHDEPVQAVAFHPDGLTLASASQDGTLRLWDVDALSESACLDPQEGWLNALAFDPGGMTVAVAAEEDIIIWDIDTR